MYMDNTMKSVSTSSVGIPRVTFHYHIEISKIRVDLNNPRGQNGSI
jgi:hypothetical protein